jgi:hypothetical protein
VVAGDHFRSELIVVEQNLTPLKNPAWKAIATQLLVPGFADAPQGI